MQMIAHNAPKGIHPKCSDELRLVYEVLRKIRSKYGPLLFLGMYHISLGTVVYDTLTNGNPKVFFLLSHQ